MYSFTRVTASKPKSKATSSPGTNTPHRLCVKASLCIPCAIVERSCCKERRPVDGKPHYACSHTLAGGGSTKADTRGTASLVSSVLGDYLSSFDGSVQSRGHCQDSWRLTLDRPPCDCHIQSKRGSCHRHAWERWASSPLPHAGARTHLPPAVLDSCCPRRDHNGRGNTARLGSPDLDMRSTKVPCIACWTCMAGDNILGFSMCSSRLIFAFATNIPKDGDPWRNYPISQVLWF